MLYKITVIQGKRYYQSGPNSDYIISPGAGLGENAGRIYRPLGSWHVCGEYELADLRICMHTDLQGCTV